MHRGGVIRVILPDAVPDQAMVAEAGGMGAPTVGLEKLDAFETEPALSAQAAAGAPLKKNSPFFFICPLTPLLSHLPAGRHGYQVGFGCLGGGNKQVSTVRDSTSTGRLADTTLCLCVFTNRGYGSG
jgi:hypothetical protein